MIIEINLIEINLIEINLVKKAVYWKYLINQLEEFKKLTRERYFLLSHLLFEKIHVTQQTNIHTHTLGCIISPQKSPIS